MKKTLCLILAIVALFNYNFALADNSEENQTIDTSKEEIYTSDTYSNVLVSLSIKPGFCHYTENEATLKLSDGKKDYFKSFKISDDVLSQEVIFEVDENKLMDEVNGTGVETMSEAIDQELGWIADSGMYVSSWNFVEEEK